MSTVRSAARPVFYRARQLASSIDSSHNWITKYGHSNIETRFVQKKPDYFIAYLSSHNGCKMGCRFCYLTLQDQTSMTPVLVSDYVEQVRLVIGHYLGQPAVANEKRATRVNINFMARGEPLANKNLLLNYNELYNRIEEVAEQNNLNPKMNISTIMPHTMHHRSLVDVFGNCPANIYYSMYSIDEEFRQKWLPNALPWQVSLDKLEEYARHCRMSGLGSVTFHWAFMKGRNDQEEDVRKLANELKSRNFEGCKFNLVRFNPHPNLSEREPDMSKLQKCFDIINNSLGNCEKSYIVPRVGRDVYASCGMFIED